jgi:uncharacterized protein
LRILTPLEARVLGVLVEKQHTVPDTYPLSLNAIVAGCNQKTARAPVIEASDAEVLTAVDGLKSLSLVFEGSSSRVLKFEHNLGRVQGVPEPAVALLAVLMLRGPQTVGELRINCERLHRFADISAVEAFLQELAQRPAGALVAELPRQAGARETRWAHLLSGAPAPEPAATIAAIDAGVETVTVSELAALKANVARLHAEIDALKATVATLCGELGVKGPS